MRTKEQEHQKAVNIFYHQEVVTLIDFRTALDAIERVTGNEYVPAEFFCHRDAERLFAAYNCIIARVLQASGKESEMATYHPTEGFPPAH